MRPFLRLHADGACTISAPSDKNKKAKAAQKKKKKKTLTKDELEQLLIDELNACRDSAKQSRRNSGSLSSSVSVRVSSGSLGGGIKPPSASGAQVCGNYDEFAALLASSAPAPPSGPSPRIVTPRGIVNQGNTCFLNSVLQMLARSPALNKALQAQQKQMALRKKVAKVAKTPADDEAELLAIELAMLTSDKGRAPLKPKKLANILERNFWIIRYEGDQRRQQQDASEAIIRLLDSASTAGGKIGEVSGSLVEAAVATVLSLTTTCAINADHKTCRLEKFVTINLPFATNELPGAAAPPQPRSLKTRLVEMLHETEEMRRVVESDGVVKDDQYECTPCGRKVDAVRTTALQRLPASLFVILQRTAFTKSLKPYKVTVPVPIDATLDLTVDARVVRYELAAVVQHHGEQIRRGHYTAFVRCELNGRTDGFAYISDTEVEKCKSQEQTIGVKEAEESGFIFLYNAI